MCVRDISLISKSAHLTPFSSQVSLALPSLTLSTPQAFAWCFRRVLTLLRPAVNALMSRQGFITN